MAQPDQVNPFAVPPSGGVPGDSFAQHQPMQQSDNPFASTAKPPPQQQMMSNPFASNHGNAQAQTTTAMDSSGTAGASGAPVAAQENPFNSSGPSPLQQQQGYVPDAQVPVQQTQFQQNLKQAEMQQSQQTISPPQQTFAPQPLVQGQQTSFSHQAQQGQVQAQQQQAAPPQEMPQQQQPTQPPSQPAPPQQQGFAVQPQYVAQQSQQGMQPQFSQPQPPQQQPQVPAAGAVPQPPATSADPFSNALVPAAQPANPYASYAQPSAPQQANPFGAQAAMVPVAPQQQQSQWGVPASAAAAATAVGSAPASFDPFAPPPPPPAPAPPAPAPNPVPAPSNQIVPAPASQVYYQAPDFPFNPDEAAPAPAVVEPAQKDQQAPDSSASVGPPVNEVNAVHGGHSVVSEPETTLTRRSIEDHDRDMVPHHPPAPRPSPQNKYSQELARNAPPGSGPLPKGELVVKGGYILSRISFRTILMKKWKQTYWIQYGRHTMLWFRSENHFNEWLSNPYLTQAQRNFLVKLAINFVHDLYKPNVRGYQVTQSHTKPYGRKLIRQFKLERWMDYGPTIAAAFGSPDQKEVDELRQTIIECMRNTPLENGIRATGAVRQDYNNHQNSGGYGDHHQHGYSGHDDHGPRGQPYEVTSSRLDNDPYNRTTGQAERAASSVPIGAARSVVSANDLLDDQRVGYDDAASYGGYSTGGQQHTAYSRAPPPHGQPRPMNQPYAQHQGPPPPHQQQYAGYR